MSSSDALKWLNENFNFVDSVTIIDHSGTIITKQRFNPRYTDEENAADNQWALGKNLLEVFPGQNFRSSALLAALKTNGVIYRQQEIAWNHLGKKSVTNNLTIPIVCRGQFVGSVQLSRDVTNMGCSGRSAQRAREESSAPAATGARYTLEDIVGQSPEIQEVRRLIQRIANSSSSVLVYGETGTGKELWCPPSTTPATARIRHSCPSTAPRCRSPFWRACCSAPAGARSPAQRIGWG